MRYDDGIYTDISIEDYHKSAGYSATQLKYAKQSLKHFRMYLDGRIEKPKGSHFGFGNAFELALLSPDEYLKRVAVFPDGELMEEAKAKNPKLEKLRSSKVYQEGRDKFHKEAEGKYIINDIGAESFETIEEMLSSCYQDKVIQGLIKNTEYQLSCYWTDPETGIQLKTRPDFVKRKKNVIVNVKTTIDGSPKGFQRDCVEHDYFLQAIIEITGCVASGLMEKVDNYFWLVVEKVPPYNATVYDFKSEDIASMRMTLEYTLNKIRKAQESELWPGYSQEADNEHGILTMALPTWYRL